MRGFLKNKDGGSTVLVALLLPVLFGMTGLTMDVANLYQNKTALQNAADAAALGAVLLLPNSVTASTQAVTLAKANVPANYGTIISIQDVTAGFWDATARTFTAGFGPQNAVKVVTHRRSANGNPVQTYFGQFLGSSTVDVQATAIAVRYAGTCINVLDPSASNALTVGGSADVSVSCTVQVNSSNAQAAYTQGSGLLHSQRSCINGGYSGNGWIPAPQTGCPILSDPLGAIPEPAQPTASCAAPGSGATMTPNCTYTGNITLSGNVTMPSGLYYFKSANFVVGSNVTLTGSGVLLFFDKNSTVSFSGNANVTLSAQSTGIYGGILIFQSRSTPSTTTVTIWGDGSLTLDGSLYAPSCLLSMGGNSTLTLQLGYAIADKMNFGGSSLLSYGSFNNGVAPRLLRPHAALVG